MSEPASQISVDAGHQIWSRLFGKAEAGFQSGSALRCSQMRQLDNQEWQCYSCFTRRTRWPRLIPTSCCPASITYYLLCKANMWFQSHPLCYIISFLKTSIMVFTRKRQAEDDAAQVTLVDEACSAAILSNAFVPAPSAPTSVDNMVVISAVQASQSASARRSGTIKAKSELHPLRFLSLSNSIEGAIRKQKKVKVESNDEEHPATGQEPSIRMVDSKPPAKRRRSNKSQCLGCSFTLEYRS